jgi:tetratricopeptide (TPR) repeat protein
MKYHSPEIKTVRQARPLAGCGKRVSVMLSGRRGDKHLLFLIGNKQKQILLPRLRDQDDMVGGFFRSLLVVAPLYFVLCLVPQSLAARPQNSAAASAASSKRAAIGGTVRDPSGNALSGVKLTLTDERTLAESVVVTADDGAYLFTPAAAGTYTLTTALSGFENAVRPHLTVGANQRLNVEFSLVPRPFGRTGEAVNRGAIAGDSPPDGQRADSQRLFSHFEYDDKPNYKPGAAASSTQPGGYSSGANADSYDLILDYVESERPADERNEAHDAEKSEDRYVPAESNALREGGRSEIDQAALEAWNENQFFSHGSELLLHRKFAPAGELFQRGVASFPASAKLQMGLGITLYARGLYDQAVSALVQATDMVPSDARPYLLLAKAYNASRSQSREVAKRLERWVELEPKSAPAWYYYALSLWRGGKPGGNTDRIEHSLKSAVALDPRFAEAHLELGALYAEQANYTDAISEYRRAVVIRPDLAAAHYRLAQAYARTGALAAARAELDLYEHLQPRKRSDSR